MNRLILAGTVFFLSLISNFIGVVRSRADQVDDACSQGTWANCGNAVKQELDQSPTDPERIVHLAQLWAAAFSTQYDALRQKGHLESSTPDSDKIREAIVDKLTDPVNPIQMAKDAAKEALVEKYLPELGTVFEFAEGPLGVALQAFFTSSDIASDYDELRQMNDGIQQEIANLMKPTLVDNWKDLLNQAATSAAPSLNNP